MTNVTKLVETLNNHNTLPETRVKTAKELGEVGAREPEVIDALTRAMLNDPCSETDYGVKHPVRAAAAEALAEMPAVIELEKWYEVLNDRDSSVRYEGVRALGKLGSRESLPHLIEMVKDEDFLVREQALASLGEIAKEKDKEVIETVNSCLMEEGMYGNAIQALGQIWNIDALKQLGEIFDHYLPDRISAAKSLGQQRDERALKPLFATLKFADSDKERPLREAVVEALGKFGEPAVSLLRAAIDQLSGGARLAAIRTMALTHTSNAIEFLLNQLNEDINPQEKQAIWEGLQQDPQVIINMLSNPDKEVRVQATRFFPLMGMTRAEQEEAIIKLVVTDTPPPGFDAEILAKALNNTKANQDYATQRLIKEAAKLIVRDKDTSLSIENPAKLERLLSFTKSFAGRVGAAGAILILADSKVLEQEKANTLWMELGGSMAMKMLGARFDESFRKPVKEVWKEGNKNWQTTATRADWGFKIMLGMDVLVFVLGIIIAGISVYFLATSRSDDLAQLFGSGVTFLGGMAILLSMFYKGPVEKINNSIMTFGRIHTAFLGLMNRLAQMGSTFEYLYMKEQIDLSELKKMNEFLEDAMRDTNELLSTLVVVSADKKTKELLERVLPEIDKGDKENKDL